MLGIVTNDDAKIQSGGPGQGQPRAEVDDPVSERRLGRSGHQQGRFIEPDDRQRLGAEPLRIEPQLAVALGGAMFLQRRRGQHVLDDGSGGGDHHASAHQRCIAERSDELGSGPIPDPDGGLAPVQIQHRLAPDDLAARIQHMEGIIDRPELGRRGERTQDIGDRPDRMPAPEIELCRGRKKWLGRVAHLNSL